VHIENELHHRTRREVEVC